VRVSGGSDSLLRWSQQQPFVDRFRTRLFGDGEAMDAFELRDVQLAGYQFQIIGNPVDDLQARIAGRES